MLIIYILLLIIAIGVFLISEAGREILRVVSRWGLVAATVIFALLVLGGFIVYIYANPSAQPIAAKLALILFVMPFLHQKEANMMNKIDEGVKKNDPKSIRRAYWIEKFAQVGIWFVALWTITVLILGFNIMLSISSQYAILYVAGIGVLFGIVRILHRREQRITG